MKEQEILIRQLENIREERQMSYYTLAAKSEMPITTLINIVSGNTKNPGFFTLMKICKGLGVTIFDLLDTEEFRAEGKKETE